MNFNLNRSDPLIKALLKYADGNENTLVAAMVHTTSGKIEDIKERIDWLKQNVKL